MPAPRNCSLSAASLFALFVFGLAALAPSVVWGASNSDARLAIHLTSATSKNACSGPGTTPACRDIVTSGGLYPNVYYGYLLGTNGDPFAGLAGLQCGLSYDAIPHSGVDIFTWNLCASLDFQSGGWPASHGGNLITWDTTTRCQRAEPGGPGTGVVAMAGFFYLAAYSPDALQLAVRPADGQARVASCTNAEYTIEGGGVHANPPVLGSASFSVGGTSPGYNPCNAEPITIDCTISGPDTVAGGATGLVYAAPQAPPGATFTWTISGFGNIVGSASGTTVTVNAAASGDFWLAVSVAASGTRSDCWRHVTIVPPTPSCQIEGPSETLAREPNVRFYVSASGPITSAEWSVSGNATISGNAHDPVVDVTAGEPGAFDLAVVVRVNGYVLPTTCHFTTTVVAPEPGCFISSPAMPGDGLPGLLFSVSPHVGQLASVAWTITGDGSIVSDPHAPEVRVVPAATGSFELAATIHLTYTDTPATCSRLVTIDPSQAPTCRIVGPATTAEGTPDVEFSLDTSGTVASVNWAISGDGVLTSSPTLPTAAHVRAGDVGAFELTATVMGLFGTGSTCTRSVTVNPLACEVFGPEPVRPNRGGFIYTTGQALAGATYQWEISGNGLISGTSQAASVIVTSGAAGAFTLGVTITRAGVTHSCSRTVTVNETANEQTQADAKILVHLMPRTVRDPCGARGTPVCRDVNTAGALYPIIYYAYLIVADGDAVSGIGELQCGIDYDAAPSTGVDIFTWSLCASSQQPTAGPHGAWPAAGSGNRITWDSTTRCQRYEPGGTGSGAVANAGYFYCAAYSADQLRVIPSSGDGLAVVADCAGAMSLVGGTGFPPTALSHLGSATFSPGGLTPGRNPCGDLRVPVRITTWSAIKGLYGKAPAAPDRRNR